MTTHPQKQIEAWRNEGFQVRVRHHRVYRHLIDGWKVPLSAKDVVDNADVKHGRLVMMPRGGFTEVTVWDEDGNFLTLGDSRCSDADNFCKRLGLTIAVGRALSTMP